VNIVEELYELQEDFNLFSEIRSFEVDNRTRVEAYNGSVSAQRECMLESILRNNLPLAFVRLIEETKPSELALLLIQCLNGRSGMFDKLNQKRLCKLVITANRKKLAKLQDHVVSDAYQDEILEAA